MYELWFFKCLIYDKVSFLGIAIILNWNCSLSDETICTEWIVEINL